jgi:hypothetical protein
MSKDNSCLGMMNTNFNSYVLDHTLHISNVTWTHDSRSYMLEQVDSSDVTESNSYTYWAPLKCTGTFASTINFREVSYQYILRMSCGRICTSRSYKVSHIIGVLYVLVNIDNALNCRLF